MPQSERHGGLLSQFTLWLSANLQITAIVTGALARVFGSNVYWSLIGLWLGQLIGGMSWPCTPRKVHNSACQSRAVWRLRRHDPDQCGLLDVSRLYSQRLSIQSSSGILWLTVDFWPVLSPPYRSSLSGTPLQAATRCTAIWYQHVTSASPSASPRSKNSSERWTKVGINRGGWIRWPC